MSEAGRSIIKGAREALDYAKGRRGARRPTRVEVPAAVDVKAIRAGLGLTQAEFAARFGFSLATLRDWEQARRRPDSATRVLLRVIEREPEAVERALRTREGA